MKTEPQHQLLELINELTVAPSGCDIEQRWHNTLQKIFDSAQIHNQDGYISNCQPGQNSSELHVPAFGDSQHHLLISCAPATLGSHDAPFVDSLLTLARRLCTVQDAAERGASEERRRIARDLHDDVAARMLTLIHQLKDQDSINLARSLLKSLRNAIYTLDTKTNTLIKHALADIRAELQERLNAIGMQLFWSQADNLVNLTFTPRQHINLQRMLHEITTNVIRHANAHFISISIDLEDNQLHILACDDGAGFDIKGCVPGKGINNIHTRVSELHGQVDWRINNGCCIDIRFPVSTGPNTSEKN
ncbi:MAG: hypothetical protein QG652_780 [Pseudomonadota bacterium]|nr:hypothetical protein [Pseudomonadota bacterium]